MSIKYHGQTVASTGGLSDNAKELIDALDEKKQDLLTGLPGQAVGFTADGSAAPVQGWSNENLLDNSRWDNKENIINQKGQGEYAGGGYTIDRWRLYNPGRVTLKDSGIFIESLASTMALRQTLEDLPAGTYTISALTEERGLVTCSGNVNESGDRLIVVVDHFELALDFTGKFFNMYLDAANQSVTVIAAKLELGSQQTLAHQDEDGNWVLNDPPPDKALELAKCQSYQYVFGSILANAIDSVMGYATSTNTALFIVQFPVKMRVLPTLVAINPGWAWRIRKLNGEQVWFTTNGGVFSMKSSGQQSAEITVTTTTERFTAGEPLNLCTNEDAATGQSTKQYVGQLVFDANL